VHSTKRARGRVARVVIGFVVALAATTFLTTPAGATGASCTYDTLPAPVTAVTPGAVIAIACTGLAPGQSVTINEESPLAAVVVPSSSWIFEASTGTGVTVAADLAGTISTSFAVPVTFTASDPAAACPPSQAQVNAGLTACTLTVRDAVSTTNVVTPARIAYTGQPTPQVTPAANIANGVSFVAGDVVTFTGSGFWGSFDGAAPTVSFGATAAAPLPASPVAISATTYVCTTDCNGAAGTLTPGGVLTGSVVVPSGLVSGTTPVSILQPNVTPFLGNGPFGSVAASTQVTILGAPQAFTSPVSGGVGTPVQVTGTGWDPQGPAPTLAFLTPSAPGGTTSQANALVDANGNLAGVLTVAGTELQGVNPIVVTQGARTAQAGYTVTDVTTLCVGVQCTNNQVLTQAIGQGDLEISEQSFNVALTPITLNGTAQHSSGQLNGVTVTDDRGTLVGWTLTGTLQGDFLNQSAVGIASNNVIPATNLTWTPNVALTAPGSGALAQVNAGPASPLSKTTGVTLCAAPVGGGGGSYVCGAVLDLLIPASVAAGTYTAVLNLTIT